MVEATMPWASVNAMDEAVFVAAFGDIFEHSPWVASAAFAARPFASIAALHHAMAAVVAAAPLPRQLELLCAHPDLATPATLTAASAAEQQSLGLDRLDATEAAAFDRENQAYRDRFGFPFIIAVRGQRDRSAIRTALLARMQHGREQEIGVALAEVDKIARFRLEARIDG